MILNLSDCFNFNFQNLLWEYCLNTVITEIFIVLLNTSNKQILLEKFT